MLASECISYYTLHACNQLILSDWSFFIRLNCFFLGHLEPQQVIALSMKFLFVRSTGHELSLGGYNKLLKKFGINILIIVPYIL